jgi:hypothetical protein
LEFQINSEAGVKQTTFNKSDLRRLELVDGSTNALGVRLATWSGRKIERLVSGGVMIIYNADGWAVNEFLDNAKRINPHIGLIENIQPDSPCKISVVLFKLGGFFRNIFVANFSLIALNKQVYIGSLSRRTLDDMLPAVGDALNRHQILLKSTADAIKTAISERRRTSD